MKSFLLLRATLSRCRSKFREYFPALLLVCAIAYPAYFFLDNSSQSLLRPTYSVLLESPPQLSVSHPLVRTLLRVLFLLAQSFVCWMAVVVSLAAISGSMLNEKKNPAQVRLSAAFQRVWSARWGALVVLSFFAAGLTTLFYAFVRPIFTRLLMAIWYYSGLSFSSALTAGKFVDAVSVVLICVMLAKMALAVPELVDDHDILPGRAIRNSLAATLGWEWVFTLLFSVIAALGYAINLFFDGLLYNSVQYQQLSSLGREVIRGALWTILVAIGLMLATTLFANLYFILRYGAETSPETEPMENASAAP